MIERVGLMAQNPEFERAVESRFPGEKRIYISHGWIDSHIHIGKNVAYSGKLATLANCHGVACFIDAGTSGCQTLRKNIAYVEKAQLNDQKLANRNFFWLVNVASRGLESKSELSGAFFDRACLAESLTNAKAVGIKVRASRQAVGANENGLFACLTEMAAWRPTTVFHIGNPPPSFENLSKHIKKGDVVTHFFNGKENVDARALASKEIGFARDVGWGKESFSFATYEKAVDIDAGPTTISTDLHENCAPELKEGLQRLASVFLSEGMSLEAVVKAMTTNPYDIFLAKKWPKYEKTFTAFVIESGQSSDVCVDAEGKTRKITKKVRALAMVGLNGVEFYG